MTASSGCVIIADENISADLIAVDFERPS